ncbi:site-specific integrase [Nocardiopsis sp. LOL_012]|uniref:site-specific integrase n=1 Tax=Nocardiopsis sp. LOL_012 TaxID=3345409 RepID=UPI003A86A2E6
MRIGPFRTRAEAQETLRHEISRTSYGGVPSAHKITVESHFNDWLARQRPRLAVSTFADYERVIRNIVQPTLGHVKLVRLTTHHLRCLYAALGADGIESNSSVALMAERLAPSKTGPDAPMRKGTWKYPLSAKRIRKVHSIISSGLTRACKTGLIAHNPAWNAGLPKMVEEPALVWTEPRVTHWRETGRKPATVMVWTPEQCGQFLDYLQETRDRQYALFQLAMTRGPRCNELTNLLWRDLDLSEPGIITIRGTKTPRSYRTFHLGQENVAALRRWYRVQEQERWEAGLRWTHSGHVFTNPRGEPVTRNALRHRFTRLTAAADVPPIRLHDLRHCAASLGLTPLCRFGMKHPSVPG